MRERKINRMEGYDYRSSGYYYVTICTKDRKEWFGKIDGRKVVLNDIGRMAEMKWKWLKEQYMYIELDEFIVMPNHIHGVIHINNVGTGRDLSLQINTMPKFKDLSGMIGAYKTVTSKEIHLFGYKEFSWQRSFYDHIVRTEYSLQKIREYIRWNPLKWDIDPENQEVTASLSKV